MRRNSSASTVTSGALSNDQLKLPLILRVSPFLLLLSPALLWAFLFPSYPIGALLPHLVVCIHVQSACRYDSVNGHNLPKGIGIVRTVFMGSLMASVCAGWVVLVTYPVLCYYARLRVLFPILCVYLPYIVAISRSKEDRFGYFGSLVVCTFADPPLRTLSLLLHRLLKIRLFPPLCSTIDENICMGSMPMKGDAELLIAKYKICAVVNMCFEYCGPIEDYIELRLPQLHLPTLDATCPKLEMIRKGIAFIDRQLELNPKKRVFIHCRAGRGRSGVLVLCYLIHRKKCSILQALDFMSISREGISRNIAKYPAVIQFEKETLSKFGNSN